MINLFTKNAIIFAAFIVCPWAMAGNLLWVGAHPDDEIYISPLLGKVCTKPGNACSMLTLTKGEKGKCLREQGCGDSEESFKAIRSEEMENSARFFNAHLTQWDLGDGKANKVEEVLSKWSEKVGNTNDLLQDVQLEIMYQKPDALIIFDPRHGTSCHTDHKASATLVLHAARLMEFPLERVYMLESLPEKGITSDEKSWLGFRAITDDSRLLSFDGSLFWQSLLDVLRVHQSQYGISQVDSVSVAPASARKIHLLRASDAVENDSRYWVCP